MAQSRLEKIGTIFTRVTGLLRANAMKSEDKPIWYDVYAAFPPKLEPRFDRPAPNVPIRNIFYEEDVVRAKYHKTAKQYEMINLADTKRETQSQQFIKIYNDLKAQGPLDQEEIFATAQQLLAEKRQQVKEEAFEAVASVDELSTDRSSKLLDNFKEASEAKITKPPKEDIKKTKAVDIENLFKE